MVEFIITQNRDKIYMCEETSFFNIKSINDNAHILYINNNYLGVYPTYERALKELCDVHNNNTELHGVEGYDDNEFAPDIEDMAILSGGLNI